MLPARFRLHRPQSMAEAFALMAQHGDDAAFYAGGTELLIAMKSRVLRYPEIIDIKRIPGMDEVVLRPDGTLSIGALATHHRLANHPLVREHFPAYAELSGNVANIRVRAAGTLGGNLCFAEPHADPPALLCALGATLVLAGSEGERRVAMEDFILGEFTTERRDDELLAAIEVPPMPAGARAAYRSFGHMERPAAGVAALAVPAATGWDWRFWVGAACSRPSRLPALERTMAGLDGEAALAAIGEASCAAAAELEVHDDMHGAADYKRHLITVLAHRAAKACLP